MAFTITMPKLGLTMNSGSVQEWKKNIGDPVKKGEILYVVATDKLTVDVESPADGVLLAITIKPGEEVPVGEAIGAIGEAGETVAAAPSSAPSVSPATSASAPGAAPAAAPTPVPAASRSGRAPSSPKAKKIAREKGIDLAAVTGTGPNGWIVANDVLNAEAATPKASPVAAKMAKEAGIDLAEVNASGSRIMKADVAAALAPSASSVSGASSQPVAGERRIPMTQMRRVIGERMLASTTSIPSVHYFVDVDMTALNAMRASYNARLAKKAEPVKVSVNDILMKFCAKLLLDYPLLNGSVEKDAFVMHDYVNIGFAVALTGGLLVPNIKNVQMKGLETIARERAALVDQTRGGGLFPDSMSGGTFTISNIGMMGVDSFTPIINPPEVAILGVGATRETPVVRNGEIVIRPVATLCLAADHRLVDGADAAAFVASLRELIEDPDLFLL